MYRSLFISVWRSRQLGRWRLGQVGIGLFSDFKVSFQIYKSVFLYVWTSRQLGTRRPEHVEILHSQLYKVLLEMGLFSDFQVSFQIYRSLFISVWKYGIMHTFSKVSSPISLHGDIEYRVLR